MESFIGRQIQFISKRTGRIVTLDLALASSFPTPKDFQVFLLELYMKDFGVYQVYSQFLLVYLNSEPSNLSKAEILENKTILSTIDAMFMVRDRDDFEQQEQEHRDLEQFIHSLAYKQK